MRIYPTRTAAHLALAGVVALTIGVAARDPNVVGWGGSLLVGVALARAVTLLSVLRIRSAGFEMLWTDATRVLKTTRGAWVTLRAEVRNRDTLAARYDKLRVIASPALECIVDPPAGEVKATGSVALTIRVRARRVGYHGIHGLALEVRGAPGLFEVPLTFANAFGLEALPRPLARSLTAPHGGRSETTAVSGRSGTRRGDGLELRELREHVAGDPFRKIAWKASARRGKLMVRELEREERDVVMLVLDASAELWAGVIGHAPLDAAIDAVASLANHHLARGDRVGLTIVASRVLAAVPADAGRAQLGAITRALLDRTGVLDADRSGWDETDVAVQVAEHLRPVDPRGMRDLRRARYDRLAEKAAGMRRDAPFARRAPAGTTPTDAELRHYAACFGIEGPPRLEPERDAAAGRVVEVLAGLALTSRPRPSVAHVVAPPPPSSAVEPLRVAVRALRRKAIAVRWSVPPLATGLTDDNPRRPDSPLDAPPEAAEPIIDPHLHAALVGSVEARARIASRKGELVLRSLGVKVSRPQPTRPRPLATSGEEEASAP